MILWFLGAVTTSVIITLGIVYYGLTWYSKRMEQKAQEATKELTDILKGMTSQEEITNDVKFTHQGNRGGFLQ